MAQWTWSVSSINFELPAEQDLPYRVRRDPEIFSLLTPETSDIVSLGWWNGYLYRPQLPSTSPCVNSTEPQRPGNTTRVDRPGVSRDLWVGLAPWLSDHPECAALHIEAAATRDRLQGLIFYPTDPDAAWDVPVQEGEDWNVNQATWTNWTQDVDFPIWTINHMVGSALMEEIEEYSGNFFGAQPANSSGQGDGGVATPRLWAEVAMDRTRLSARSSGAGHVFARPWIFVIMILAVLGALVGLTSLTMHLNQARLRRDLRRRIAAGQVDLERLGIRRQKVPLKLLHRMPLYTYTSKVEPLKSMAAEQHPLPPPSSSPFNRKNVAKRHVPFSQTTCAICLEDYVHDETVVRELPCQHIFHPECIDDFLSSNSSLCPTCKKSALPGGYCPEDITIAMVRRERLSRRMREYGTTSVSLGQILPAWSHKLFSPSVLRRPLRPLQGAERPQRVDRSSSSANSMGAAARPSSSDQVVEPATGQGNAPGSRRPSLDRPLPQDIPLPPSPSSPVSPSQFSPAQAHPSGDLEMGDGPGTGQADANGADSRPGPQTLDDLPPEIQALSAEERREWGRQRLMASLPPTETQAIAEERAATAHLPVWRRAWRRMFLS